MLYILDYAEYHYAECNYAESLCCISLCRVSWKVSYISLVVDDPQWILDQLLRASSNALIKFFVTSMDYNINYYQITKYYKKAWGTSHLKASKATQCFYWNNGYNQGILKVEVSLYHWPLVWLVWNQLHDNWQFLFLFAKQTNPNQSNRRPTVQWYCPL